MTTESYPGSMIPRINGQVSYSEAPVSRLTNGNTGANNWPNGVEYGFVGVNITGFAGGTNVTIQLQQLDANGVWQTIGTTAALTGVGTATFSVGVGLNSNLLVSFSQFRFAWVVTGVFTTLNFQIGMHTR